MADEPDIDLPERMAHVELLFPSKYLRKEDLQGREVTVTIDRVVLRDVQMVGGRKERKVVVHLAEMARRPENERKVLVLGKTNARAIAALYGEPDPRKWPGLRITLYEDPNVTFGGRRVGGIRVSPRKPAAAPKPEPAEAPAQ